MKKNLNINNIGINVEIDNIEDRNETFLLKVKRS